MKNLICLIFSAFIFVATISSCIPQLTDSKEDIESKCEACMEAYRQAYNAARAAGSRKGGCPRNSEAVFASFKTNIERACGTTANANAMIWDGCSGEEFFPPPCPFK